MGCMQEYEERTPDGKLIMVCPHCGYVKDTPARETYHLSPGAILQGKYIVGKVLGYGGFGVTYVGYDAQLDRKIAIKEYLPTNFSTRIPGQTKLSVYDGENGEQFRAGLKSFVEEAKRLSKLNSLPGTVDIYDSFQQNETGYIIMEYLDGKTIKETLAENGVFEYEAAKTIILKILATLKEIHKEGIVHRDISPDNIFLLEGEDVRLIDFGASRYATTLHSKSLSVILKPGYAPEEQYRSRGGQGPWSDVYALSATFYKMITGVTPEESMERMMKDDLKEPSKLGVKLPQNDENAIMNALLVKASDRIQSADEFERQLTAEDQVRRAVSTIKKYDTGRIPKWTRALAGCLGVVIATFLALLFTNVIDLQGGGLISAVSGEERLGRNETRVPNVIGEQYETANSIAAEATLLLVVTNKEYNDKVEANKVMLQAPLPGRVQLKQSALNVVVSAGEEVAIKKGVMPDVTFRTLEEALLMLEEAGVKYELVYEESDTVAKDGIIKTSINTGEEFDDNETVIVVISEGSEKQEAALEKAKEVFHQVSFVDWDGTVLNTQNIKDGARASAPKNPDRYGYRFVRWDRDFVAVVSDLTVRAVYEKIPEYTVTFQDWDGRILDRQTVIEGGDAYRPSDPYRVGYDFKSWSSGFRNVRSNLTVTAQYSPVPTYTVTFSDFDGRLLKTQTVNRGDNATAPAFPAAPRGYEYTGWSPSSFSNVRKDLTVTAVRPQLPQYTVVFIGNDGSEVKRETLYRGESATAPSMPTHPTLAGKRFDGWDTDYKNVQKNLTVKSVYYTIPLYTITFVDWDGRVLKTQSVYEGENATPPTSPSRTGYDFTGWSPGNYNPVRSSQTVTAQYSIKVYTVRFVDWDGRVIKTEQVNHGSNATPPANPTRTGHTYTGWDRSYTNVTANITVTALYNINTYTVVFQDWNGTVLKNQSVTYGSSASPPADPSRSGYRFTGWSPSYSNITANTTVIAQYKQQQYRYRDLKTETRSTNDAPSGEFVSSTTNYSAWGSWGAGNWSNSKPSLPANTELQEYRIGERDVTGASKTIYKWVYWRFYNPWGSLNYFPQDMRGYSGYSYVEGPVRCETESMLSGGVWTDMGTYYPYNGKWWFSEGSYQKPGPTTKEYRLETRTRTIANYTVTYWTAWSAWQDTPVTSSSTREVQIQDK